MILNVSGRTDIVAFYTDWFMNRYREGYIDVRNPFYPKNVSRIKLENVDMIMFCTKNPLPIIKYLKEIDKPILFHVTLTPYKSDIEVNVPDKSKIIEGIKEISNILGKENVVVRYDPIFISNKYNLEYHKKAFNKLCQNLNGYVDRIIVSFLDMYKNVEKNAKYLNYKNLTENDYKEIGLSFSKSAKDNNIEVQTCFEKRNLVEYGFVAGDCLSHELAYTLTGKKFKTQTARKDKICNCVAMADIGVYNSCNHLCKYCYANYDERKIKDNMKKHDPNSTLLIGHINDDDTIKERIK